MSNINRVLEGWTFSIIATSDNVVLTYGNGVQELKLEVAIKGEWLLAKLKTEKGSYGPDFDMQFKNSPKLSPIEILALPIQEYIKFYHGQEDAFNKHMMIALLFDICIRADIMENFKETSSLKINGPIEGFD